MFFGISNVCIIFFLGKIFRKVYDEEGDEERLIFLNIRSINVLLILKIA